VSATGEAARRFAAETAIVFGSGLAVVPAEAVVVARLPYAGLGWPTSGVAGHGNELLLATVGERRLLLANGRPHAYEGRSPRELRVAVDDMVLWGVRHLVLTNAAGGLADWALPGTAVVVTRVVDLQRAPVAEPDELPATAGRRAQAVCAALAAHIPARAGRYVAVPGPQYETPSEAAWLADHADAVGMSTAPEVRAAAELGVEIVVLAFVVNRASAVSSHDEVLAVGHRLAEGLRASLGAVLEAAWPAEGAVE
jgi:purine-nucleoside phosphorylase